MEKNFDFVVNTYLPHKLPNHFGNLENIKENEGKLEDQTLKTDEQEEEGFDHGGVDRLSPLPDTLCQHVLSFIPATDARRTAFLSKRWRFMWSGCPSFDFDERNFHGRPLPVLQRHRKRQTFIRFVDEAIGFRKRYFDDLSIDKFRVSMRFVAVVGPHLDNWIAFALESNVKELSVIAEMKDLIANAEFCRPLRVPYTLPQAVFTTNSIRCLELVFCDLSQLSTPTVELPSLRNLDMMNVHVNDSIFQSILSGSPLLEKINLSLICGLQKIQITNKKLKMLMIFKCSLLEEVIVKAPDLESFLFRGKRDNPDKIDISSCQKLKFLWLQRASNLTDDMLEQVTHNNPNLEIMILSHCNGLRNAVVNSPKLWMFVLFKCKHLSMIKIGAPNLSAFEYSGHMITFPSVVSSAQLDVVIHIDGPGFSRRWYAKLKEMFARFEHCRTLWILCEHDIDLIVPHELRKCLLPQLHGLTELKIHVRSGIMNLEMLEDGIRWIFPGLKNLYVESGGSTHHFRYWGPVDEAGSGPIWRKRRAFITKERQSFY